MKVESIFKSLLKLIDLTFEWVFIVVSPDSNWITKILSVGIIVKAINELIKDDFPEPKNPVTTSKRFFKKPLIKKGF